MNIIFETIIIVVLLWAWHEIRLWRWLSDAHRRAIESTQQHLIRSMTATANAQIAAYGKALKMAKEKNRKLRIELREIKS